MAGDVEAGSRKTQMTTNFINHDDRWVLLLLFILSMLYGMPHNINIICTVSICHVKFHFTPSNPLCPARYPETPLLHYIAQKPNIPRERGSQYPWDRQDGGQ